jgi:hypothetical protein
MRGDCLTRWLGLNFMISIKQGCGIEVIIAWCMEANCRPVSRQEDYLIQ